VLECRNILGGGGEFSRDLLDMKWEIGLGFDSSMMFSVGINH
jgi:hypothetical protein